eukprot:g9627.t1
MMAEHMLSKDLKSISEGNKGGHILLVKCTSDHYFQSVQAHNLPEGTTVVEIEFEQAPEDVAAKARCQFAKFVIEQKVITPEGLKDFKSQEWSLDERRCTIQKVFYALISEIGALSIAAASHVRRKGPVSLNADGRKQEIYRIMKENHQLLQNIETCQPVVRTSDMMRWDRMRKRYIINASHTMRMAGEYDDDIMRIRDEDRRKRESMKRSAKRKQKAVEQAQDFSDLSEDVKPKKVKVRVKKKVQAQRERSPDNFSDMNSEEFNARAKKGKKAASDESGSGRKKKVKRAHDSEERQKRNKDSESLRGVCWRLLKCFMPSSNTTAASAVLLTTHSMEEAEALSNRLGIMADGQLLTVGTAQQIKAKHGACHELMLRLRPETEDGGAWESRTAVSMHRQQWPAPLSSSDVNQILESDSWKRAAYARPRCIVRLQLEQGGVVEPSVFAEWFLQQAKGERVEQFLSTLLGDHVELAEDFGIYWRFRLPRTSEDHAESFGVAEYTLSQATLEQIFNSITEGADAFGGQAHQWVDEPCFDASHQVVEQLVLGFGICEMEAGGASSRELVSEDAEVRASPQMYSAVGMAMVGAAMFGFDQGNFGDVQAFKSFRDEWCIGRFGDAESCGDQGYLTNGNWNENFITWGATLITFGAAAGAILAGPPLKPGIGRRPCIQVGGAVCFLGCILASYASFHSVVIFFIGRFITGQVLVDCA